MGIACCVEHICAERLHKTCNSNEHAIRTKGAPHVPDRRPACLQNVSRRAQPRRKGEPGSAHESETYSEAGVDHQGMPA